VDISGKAKYVKLIAAMDFSEIRVATIVIISMEMDAHNLAL
jgi:hypothetical protein